jgi:hypothetical protein
MRKTKTTAPARFRIEAAVTHGNGNSSGGTGRGGSGIGQESPEAAPRADARAASKLNCMRK